jgi:pyocin large subunit-like protein
MVNFVQKMINNQRTGDMLKKQKKKTAAPRFGDGSPATDYKSKSDSNMPSYMKATIKPKASTMDKEIYKPSTYSPTDTTGGSDMGRDARTTRSDGNSVPVSKKTIKDKAPVPTHLVSKNTPSGENRMDKKKKNKNKNKPIYRTKVTMTSMRVKY